MTADVAVDVVVLTLQPSVTSEGQGVRVLLSDEPSPRLPGATLGPDEDLEDAAARVLASVGLVHPRHVEQLASFGAPGRVTGARTVSVTYLALVPEPFALPDGWVFAPAGDRPATLAWDHDQIVDTALQRVRSKLSYSTIAYGLLPDEFTMSELQEVYEAVLDTTLDKRNFRKKVRSLGLVEDTGRKRRGSHRPAALHRFVSTELVLLDDVIISS